MHNGHPGRQRRIDSVCYGRLMPAHSHAHPVLAAGADVPGAGEYMGAGGGYAAGLRSVCEEVDQTMVEVREESTFSEADLELLADVGKVFREPSGDGVAPV